MLSVSVDLGSLERATELESRLFLTEKESTNMQQLQINILFSTISLSVGSFRLIFNLNYFLCFSPNSTLRSYVPVQPKLV